MPALNFQARFAQLVKSGKKCQTIRKRRRDGRDPKPGDTLYLYTGMRTKRCRKLREAICTSVGPVEINGPAFGGLLIGSLMGSDVKPDTFAKRDGFKNFEEMVEWFDKVYGLPFEGLVIRWEKP